jgi:hypothetical protein
MRDKESPIEGHLPRVCRLEPFLSVGSKRSAPDIHAGKHGIGGPTRLYLPGSRAVLGIHPTVFNGSVSGRGTYLGR